MPETRTTPARQSSQSRSLSIFVFQHELVGRFRDAMKRRLAADDLDEAASRSAQSFLEDFVGAFLFPRERRLAARLSHRSSQTLRRELERRADEADHCYRLLEGIRAARQRGDIGDATLVRWNMTAALRILDGRLQREKKLFKTFGRLLRGDDDRAAVEVFGVDDAGSMEYWSLAEDCLLAL